MSKVSHITFLGIVLFVSTFSAFAEDKTLSSPSDDRWHYPFNGTPGFRTRGSAFTSSPFGPFDYRDAMVYLRFRPETTDSLSAAYIPSGMFPDCYQFGGVQLVVYHNNALAYTWDTDSTTTDSLGSPFELQIFGMGNDDSVTSASFTLETWTETSPYFGKLPAPTSGPRNPHPLNLNEFSPLQNVTNAPSASWGSAQVPYGSGVGEYTPGVMPSVPFPITYTLDISNPRVRRYVQESLAKGRVDWVLSTTTAGSPNEAIPDFLLKENTANLPPRLILQNFSLAPTEAITIASPEEDRWHYPFNGTPGSRTLAPVFTATLGGGFNYRDAQMYLRFRPETANSAAPDYIEPGLPAEAYHLASARLTVYCPPSAGLDPFTWDTRDGVTTDTMGNLQMIQLFGMDNDDALTSGSFILDSWVETSPYFGAVPFPGSSPRNPHPVNLDESANPQNITDEVSAQPWALGHPVYGSGNGEYSPGVVAPEPFAVTFELDLSNERIRTYLQESLSLGRVDWTISGTFNSSMGGGTQYPQFITKENVLNLPPRLELEFCIPATNSARHWSRYE